MKQAEPIPEEMRPYLRRIARHEYGHWISARLLGFLSGDVTLRLLSANGDHVATTEIFVDQPLPGVAAILDYLERRIVTLSCGTIAEFECPEEINSRNIEQTFQQGGGTVDYARIQDLLALHVNIMMPSRTMTDADVLAARHHLFAKLTARAGKLVASEFALIDLLAEQHVECLTTMKLGWGYPGEDIEAMPQVRERLAQAACEAVGAATGMAAIEPLKFPDAVGTRL